MSFDTDLYQQKPNFQGAATNINFILQELSNLYSNINVGAYILLSDGIYNEGLNPLYTNTKLNAPLYSVVIGDTTIYQDCLIRSVKSNKISYIGNETEVEVIIEAEKMQGISFLCEVFNHTVDPNHLQPIYIENGVINSSNYIHKLKFFISPNQPGLQTYYVRLKSNQNENNIVNNNKYFFVDVIDDRKQILVLFSNPHPDISAIKESLESHDQYNVQTYWTSTLDDDQLDVLIQKKKWSLIIGHQLSNMDTKVISTLHNHPIFYIMGANSDLGIFNQMQDCVQFHNSDNVFEFSDISLNKNFSSFIVDDSLSDFLSLSTPFLTPFSNLSISYLSDVFLYKKIGSVVTGRPILFFTENKFRSAFLLGEGLWRWRLNDTYLNNNNNLFNMFMSKIIQNLLLDENKNRFHVNYEPIQYTSEKTVFEVELYNKNFELVNSSNLEIEFVDSLENSFKYQFNTLGDKYYLDVELQAGKYDFIIQTQLGDEFFQKKGDILVSDFSLESRELVANQNLLSDLALSNGGYLVPRDSINHLVDFIKNKPNFKPLTYFNYSFQSFINFESLLILILCILFLEWLIRRRYINY